MNSIELPINFGPDGLVSAVIVDSSTSDVLMVGFMNALALEHTRQSGFVHFWSRSRQTIWKKGETSGHVQEVVSIAVNCELNSLLVEVNQIGAVCHDGYPTCYYRILEPDNSLTTIRDRWFDPADVYGEESGLAGITKRWWGAYETLRSTNLEAQSGTSRLLREAQDRVTSRIADELLELAGALDGTHRHVGLTSDVALEGGQVCYWIALRCIRDGMSWDDVRPDRALDTQGNLSESASRTVAQLLRREAELWALNGGIDVAAMAHGTLSLVAGACSVAGVEPKSLIVADLNELRTRSYLEDYFTDVAAGTSNG
jgi:phosphoribosyl-AMP cyclohydrolase/phosphoribosyl-ATP pyrophosphohydrolase